MLVNMLLRGLRFISNPFVLAALFILLLVAWISRGEVLLEDRSMANQIRADIEELKSNDPKAAAILARIEGAHQRDAIEIAALSASADGRRRAILYDMAEEMDATDDLPYRARIASLALKQLDLRDVEMRSAFLQSHLTVCESLTIGENWGGADEYLALLEQAARMPNVWPKLRDDPLGLVLWAHLDEPESELLSFYHRNREWLADPLAALDLSGVDGGLTVQDALMELSKHEKSLRMAVEEGGLGVYALAVLLNHGTLVDICLESYQLDPAEVISIIVFNRDIFGEKEGDARWIGEKSTWLSQIRQRHITVWFAAMQTPLALRLHQDAPHVSESLLEKYGAENLTALIYQHFSQTDQVGAAASAIDKFGDLALYVFARYEDQAFINKLGNYLVDDEIGIRIIPFVVRFGDDAFNRIEQDSDWVDRYFNTDGTPKVDSMEWIKFIPGGSALQVARNWAKGHPCEWSELGWAAVDVADLALTVASLGTSQTVTQPAKATATVAKAGSASAKGLRAVKISRWKSALSKFKSSPGRLGKTITKVSELSAFVRSTVTMIGKPIWGSIKLTAAGVKIAHGKAKQALNAWKSISPAKKVWIYRGLLAVSLYVTLTERTFPNVDKISTGIGTLIGECASGTITSAADAMEGALNAFLERLVGEFVWVKRTVFWLVAAILLVVSIWFAGRGIRTRRVFAIEKG